MDTSAGDGSALPVAGWYPNPHDPLTERYWTGQNWSAETRAKPAPFVFETSTQTPAATPAGWYPNPADPSTKRYWNGEAWTQDFAADATLPAGPVAYPQAPAGYATYGATAYGWVAPVSTNGLAVASLVLGILWIYWVGSLLAVIFGHVALGQIKNSGGRQGGRGLAIAGLTLGWVGFGFLALALFAVAA